MYYFTSEIGITSLQGTKLLAPMCPLIGGSTVYIHLTWLSSSPPADPTILPRVQVDKGAIRFLLSGANVMCPGLTSPGARMDVSLPQDTVVVSSYITAHAVLLIICTHLLPDKRHGKYLVKKKIFFATFMHNK